MRTGLAAGALLTLAGGASVAFVGMVDFWVGAAVVGGALVLLDFTAATADRP